MSKVLGGPPANLNTTCQYVCRQDFSKLSKLVKLEKKRSEVKAAGSRLLRHL